MNSMCSMIIESKATPAESVIKVKALNYLTMQC